MHRFVLQIDYPEIVDGLAPRHRFMSAYEQKIEPPDRKWQYLLFAAEPYETISFKVIDMIEQLQLTCGTSSALWGCFKSMIAASAQFNVCLNWL